MLEKFIYFFGFFLSRLSNNLYILFSTEISSISILLFDTETTRTE